MSGIKRSISILLVLFIIWLLNDSLQDRQVENIQATKILGTEKTPDYYSENLQLRDFNDQGELQSLIKTKKLSHYPDQRQALLESPELVMYGVEGDVWQVTSTTGRVSDSNRNLTLIDDVLLMITGEEEQPKIIIKTTELHYNVAEQNLWTDSLISAQSSQGDFTSNGLQMDLKTEQLLLKEKVRIHYDL